MLYNRACICKILFFLPFLILASSCRSELPEGDSYWRHNSFRAAIYNCISMKDTKSVPLPFQTYHTSESLGWKKLEVNSELSWNWFAQYFIFETPGEIELTTSLAAYNEREKAEIIRNINGNFTVFENPSIGSCTVRTEAALIKEKIIIRNPCVLLARLGFTRSKTILSSVKGDVLISTVQVSEKNSERIRNELLMLYEPPVGSVLIKSNSQ